MFDQIIYTRNNFGRQLEKNGIEDKSSGYKIRSFSKEIYDHLDNKEISLLAKAYIKNRNESKTTAKQGLIDSFEYVKLNNKVSFFGFQHQRLSHEDKRAGNFIKHLYVGEVNDYPVNYMNELLYPYCDYPSEYYYEMNETCDFLPSKELEPSPKYTKEQIKEFYHDGREDTIQNAISFLIEQADSSHKKVLIIKDDALNVLKWIACITYALPLELSKKISFNTNAKIEKSNVGSFMYCLDSDSSYARYAPNHENLTPHLLYDIIGISPLTMSASGFKPLPNSPFIVIDGTTKEISYTTQLNHDYLQFVCAYDENMNDFNSILKSFDHYDFNDIYKIYEIYHYLFKDQNCPNQWEYQKLMHYLEQLNDYLKPESLLKINLSVQLYKLYKSKNQWFQEDSKNDYQLLNFIFHASLQSQHSKYMNNVSSMIYQIVDFIMNKNSFDIKQAKKFWESVKKDNVLYQFVSDYYFDEEKVGSISKLKELEYIDDEVAFDYGYLIISLLNDYLKDKGLNKELFVEHSGWTGLLFNLYKLILSEDYDKKVMNLVQNYNSDVMNALTMKFATTVGFNTPITKNWITLYGSRISDNNLYNQCQDMLLAGISPKAVELLLVTYMEKQGKTSDALLKAFKLLFVSMDNDKKLGISFFDQYLLIVASQSNKYQEISRLISFVRDEQFSKSLQVTLLSRIDQFMPSFVKNREDKKMIEECLDWCRDLNMITKNLSKAQLAEEVQHLKKSHLLAFISKVRKNHIVVDEKDTEWIQIFIEGIGKYIEDSEAFVEACYMFDADSFVQEEIIKKYFDIIAKRTKKDSTAIEICIDILCSQKMDKMIRQYVESEGISLLAEYYKEDLWLDVIDTIRDRKNRAKASELNEHIKDIAGEMKGFSFNKVKEGFSSFFKKKK